MNLKDYLQREQDALNDIVNIYNASKGSSLQYEIMLNMALLYNEKLQYGVFTKDGYTDTEGCEEEELEPMQRDKWDIEYVEQELKERETLEIYGHKSFLPLLISEYTLGKNNIPFS